MVERENDCKCVFVCVYYVFDVFSMRVVVNLGSQQWANLRERERRREGRRESDRERERRASEEEWRRG